ESALNTPLSSKGRSALPPFLAQMRRAIVDGPGLGAPGSACLAVAPGGAESVMTGPSSSSGGDGVRAIGAAGAAGRRGARGPGAPSVTTGPCSSSSEIVVCTRPDEDAVALGRG